MSSGLGQAGTGAATEVRHGSVSPLPRTDVPCGTCHLCCKSFTFLREDEYEQYQWGWCMRTGDDGKQHAVGRVLNRKPNGDCVYLNDTGCPIHDRAPKVCREFDCRTLFLRSDRNGRRLAVTNGQINPELFVQGRKMLKEARRIIETGAMEEFKPMPLPEERKLPESGFSMTPLDGLCPTCGGAMVACADPACPYRPAEEANAAQRACAKSQPAAAK